MKKHKKQSRLKEFIANPGRALIGLAIPTILAMLTAMLYSFADGIFIRPLGSEAVAAISFTMPVMFFIISFGSVNAGVIAQISRSIGSGDKRQADNSAEHSLIIGVVLTVALTLFLVLYAPHLLAFFGATGNVLVLAVQYSRIVFAGAGFLIFAFIFNGILIGEGDAKTGSIINGVGCVLNIILDPIFIFWFDLGLAGAAWATMLSNAFSFLLYFIYLFKHKSSYVTFDLKNFSYQAQLIYKILAVGFPAVITHLLFAFNGVIFNMLAATYSYKAVAVIGIVHRYESLYFMPIFGVVIGLVSLVGMFSGAGRFDLAKKTLWLSLKICFVYSLALMIIYNIFARSLLSIFSDDPEIIDMAVVCLRTWSWTYLFVFAGLNIGRFIQGIGKGWPSLFINALRVLIINVPLAYFFTVVLGLEIKYLWYSPVISAIVATTIAAFLLRHYIKKVESGQMQITPAVVPEDLPAPV